MINKICSVVYLVYLFLHFITELVRKTCTNLLFIDLFIEYAVNAVQLKHINTYI